MSILKNNNAGLEREITDEIMTELGYISLPGIRHKDYGLGRLLDTTWRIMWPIYVRFNNELQCYAYSFAIEEDEE